MALQHVAGGNLMSDHVDGSTILQRKLSAMNSQKLGLLNHLECFVIPQSKLLATEHVAPETRPSFSSNNSLEGAHYFVFGYGHGLGGEYLCKCLISFGTRRLTYQIKCVLLIDWIYRYFILMGDIFLAISPLEP